MVDPVIEIPLPGRSLASPQGEAGAATLPSFIAGPENRLVAGAVGRMLDCGAAAAATCEADQPPRLRVTFPVLALYGPSGTGKTHLARGLIRFWQSRHGALSAEYLTAGDFRRLLTDALDTDTVVDFRRRLRACEVLAIDDIHRLAKVPHLQEELRYTFDALEQSGGTLVVTSPRPVQTLANLAADLRSRLSSGLVLQVAPPGTAARERLLRQVCAALGRPLTEAASHILAEGIAGTANELFGAATEWLAHGPRRAGNDVRWTRDYLAQRETRRPPLRQIIAVVAKYYGVPQKVLKSASRRQAAVFARAVAVYLARELTGASYERIGHALGGRDHTTIMHNYRKIQQDFRRDPATREAIDELTRILGGK